MKTQQKTQGPERHVPFGAFRMLSNAAFASFRRGRSLPVLPCNQPLEGLRQSRRLRADCSGPKQVGFHTRREASGARYKACDHLHGDPDAAGEPIARPISGERRSGFSLWPSGSFPGNHAVSAVQRQKARWERGTPVREMQRQRLRGAGKTDERQPEQRLKVRWENGAQR